MDRRTILLAIGASAMITITEATATQSPEIRGTIEFESGKPIPQGQIKITLKDTAIKKSSGNRAAEMQITSDGKSRAIDFSIPRPENLRASSTSTIVARLERTDGWLLARGSTELNPDAPTDIMLYTVMY